MGAYGLFARKLKAFSRKYAGLHVTQYSLLTVTQSKFGAYILHTYVTATYLFYFQVKLVSSLQFIKFGEA